MRRARRVPGVAVDFLVKIGALPVVRGQLFEDPSSARRVLQTSQEEDATDY